ncbi:MAG: matrixin family metalloprotease, partial [Chloroflexi bacterium]|nr:matrixin family metalloprotease [Chloroflexota bacterium]
MPRLRSFITFSATLCLLLLHAFSSPPAEATAHSPALLSTPERWAPPLANLMPATDIILRGRVSGGHSFWNKDHTLIFTDSVVDIHDILFSTVDMGATTRLVVRSLGGELPAENIAMGASHSPRLTPGTEYILLLGHTGQSPLTSETAPGTYTIVGGDLGSSATDGTHVWSPVGGRSLPLDTFIADLQAAWNAAKRPDVQRWRRPAAVQYSWPSAPNLAPGNYVYSGQKWPGNSTTYKVNLNSSQMNLGNGSATDFLNNILNAAATWTAVSTADFSFIYGGSTTNTSVGYNGSNDVMFIGDGTFAGSLAQATWWFNNENIIYEADLYFDDDAPWDATGAPGNNEFDVQSVALHEFGHWLSLVHDPDPPAIMYAYISDATTKRNLYTNDIAGITYIYPALATDTPTPLPTSTPTPIPTDTPTPLPTATPTPIPTATPTATSTPTPTTTPTATPTATATSTTTPTPTSTPRPTKTPSPPATPTPT